MPDDSSPEEKQGFVKPEGPLSLDQAAAALDALAESPPEAEQAEASEQPQAGDEGEEPEAQLDLEQPVEPEDELQAQEQDDETESEGDEEAEGEEPEVFDAADDTIVELDNGAKTTLGELKDAFVKGDELIKGFQRDHTQKTQLLSERSKSVETQEQRILGLAQQLKEAREDFVASVQEYLPQPPVEPELPAELDQQGWAIFSQQKHQYEQEMARFNQNHQKVLQAKAEAEKEQQTKYAEWASEQWTKALEVRPELKDEKTLAAMNADLVATLTDYGIDTQELGTVIKDHRVINLMMDLMRLRKLDKAAPKAKEQVRQKPKMLRSGKSQSLDSVQARERKQKRSRLRKDGTIDAAVDVLLQEFGG